METKHTPGPWMVDAAGNIWAAGDTKIVEMSSPPTQADCYRKKSDDEHKANARLIAAAPYGLVAAKCAYAILADIRHEWNGRHTMEGQGTLSALRDFIAAAEGREPQDVQDEYTNAALSKSRG